METNVAGDVRSLDRTRSGSGTIEGRWTLLTPVEATDLDELRRIACVPSSTSTYRYRGATPSPAAFEADLWSRALLQWTVRSRSSARIIGHVGVFSPSFRDQHAHLLVLLDPRLARRGWPLESAAILIEHAFATFDLRRLYAQMSDVSFACIQSAVRRGATVEARLIEHEYWGGRWHDSMILAIERERWRAADNRLRRRLLRDNLNSAEGSLEEKARC